MKIRLFFLMFLTAVNILPALSQEFEKKVEEEGIVVEYMWKPYKNPNGIPSQQLCLIIRNNNSYTAEVSFTMAFYDTGTVNEEGEGQTFCIKAGKAIKGRSKNLCWLVEKTEETIRSDAFDWQLDEFTVLKVTGCP